MAIIHENSAESKEHGLCDIVCVSPIHPTTHLSIDGAIIIIIIADPKWRKPLANYKSVCQLISPPPPPSLLFSFYPRARLIRFFLGHLPLNHVTIAKHSSAFSQPCQQPFNPCLRFTRNSICLLASLRTQKCRGLRTIAQPNRKKNTRNPLHPIRSLLAAQLMPSPNN